MEGAYDHNADNRSTAMSNDTGISGRNRADGVEPRGQSGGRGAMETELDKETITKAYARWAPVYDFVFGAVFEHGRRAAIDAAERVGGRIL